MTYDSLLTQCQILLDSHPARKQTMHAATNRYDSKLHTCKFIGIANVLLNAMYYSTE